MDPLKDANNSTPTDDNTLGSPQTDTGEAFATTAPDKPADVSSTASDSMPEVPVAPDAMNPGTPADAGPANAPSEAWTPPSSPSGPAANMDDSLGGIPGVSPDAVSGGQPMPPAPAAPDQMGSVAPMPGKSKKLMMAVGAAVVLVLIGFGVWYVVF